MWKISDYIDDENKNGSKTAVPFFEGARYQAVHGHNHRIEYIFDATTNFGFTAIILFLHLGQRFVAVAFFTDFVTDMRGRFLAGVSSFVSSFCRVRIFATIDG